MAKLINTIREILGQRSAGDAEAKSSGSEQSDSRRLQAPSDRLCGITDVGRVREHNEDAFHLSQDGRLLIVADGMGGHQAGEVASAIAVGTLSEFFDAQRCQAVDSGDVAAESLLLEAFDLAHERVLDAAKESPDRTDMGTTLIATFLSGDRAYVCHVGDVRCYRQDEKGLEQMTQDHSVVGSLVKAGELTPEQARVHERKNEILQGVGLSIGILPDVQCVDLAPGDRLLLCSDGLWEALPEEEIRAILDWEGSARQRATQLVDRANAAGGNDNITVVLYEHPVREA
jgi:serine/threonine protein phosphatase PrpC